MKKIIILGSTGSIGTQTLDVVDHLDSDWQVIGLSANKNIELLERQVRKYRPLYITVVNEKFANEIKYRLKDIDVEVFAGVGGLEELAGNSEADLVVNALVGAVGLKPTISALKARNRVGLANKESLVIGGSIIKKLVEEKGSEILPIDSEHNAIFQIIAKHDKKEINNILLTASGGPFLNLTQEQLKNVTVEQALNHPNWDMGGKISIDSATMMNKGLEVIEAHWLFNQPYDKIKVVIHPESIIHSMVEFVDRSIVAELGVADMRMPIQNVMTYPERIKGVGKSLNLFEIKQLNFLPPDLDKFYALKLAYYAGREGGSVPVVLNAANEVAVANFLQKKIPFYQIPEIIDRVISKHDKIPEPSLSEIFEIDQEARRATEEVIDNDINNS